uniref:Uncharacterized protein n=1 Tax=Amphimedon queenslandica TaxID=400682 RepID=A0A1X7T2F8_AMPQE
ITNLPENVTRRYFHSLSVWRVTPTTNWIIQFGGWTKYTNTAVIELRYTCTSDNDWSTSVISLDQYQDQLKRRILSDGEILRLSKEIQLLRGHLQEREKEFYEEQLQREIKEKEQIQQDRDKEQQQVLQEKATLSQQLDDATTLLEQAEEDESTLELAASHDTLYSGMMYYDEKKIGYWKAMYSVVRDLEVLKRYLESKHTSTIEYDDVVDSFKFIQSNGTLQLTLNTAQQVGWTVNPIRNPMKLFQSRVDQFPLTPSYATCSISVYAEIGVAKKPLHCPIELTGIDPSMTIYIDRCPPPFPSSMIDSTSFSSFTASNISQTRRETEE